MNPYYQRNGITIYHAKWQDVLSSLPVIDSVITDSPYGIEVTEMTLGNGKKKIYRGEAQWDSTPPHKIRVRYFARVITNTGFLGW